MVALRNITAAVFAVWLLLLLPTGDAVRAAAGRDSDALFAQSAAELLNRDFTQPELSYLLLDAKSGRVLASRWDNLDKPIPMGSLVKPFTALAYGEQHGFHFPTHVCLGTASGCWRPHGHGRMNLTTAIANSCNSYFSVLASQVTARQVAVVAAQFGIEPPKATASGTALAGIGRQWLISPAKMAKAYMELVHRREQPGISQIIDGMELSGREGTGNAVDAALRYGDALVKTGTAPCTHVKRAPGDGFAIAIWPAQQPRILLLVRVHGAPGAKAARTAGEVLRRLGE